MEIRIFTLAFDVMTESFPDEILAEFCINKKVNHLNSQFFLAEGKPYWSVAIHYEVLEKAGVGKMRMLNEEEQKLFERLKVWRREKAVKDGFPAYMIATDNQMAEMVRQKIQSLESFKSIKGFGKQRTGKYGKEIVNLVKSFYEQEAAKIS